MDAGLFEGLTRDGIEISKTFGGDEATLLASILPPPLASETGLRVISTINDRRASGETVTESQYILVHDSLILNRSNDMSYPSASLKLNVWEGTCGMEMSPDRVIRVSTGAEGWWGCSIEIGANVRGEDLSRFASGTLHFEIRGTTSASFNIGFQTGRFAQGSQVNNFANFAPEQPYALAENWTKHAIFVSELNEGANLFDITGLLYLEGEDAAAGETIEIRNLYYSRDRP